MEKKNSKPFSDKFPRYRCPYCGERKEIELIALTEPYEMHLRCKTCGHKTVFDRIKLQEFLSRPSGRIYDGKTDA